LGRWCSSGLVVPGGCERGRPRETGGDGVEGSAERPRAGRGRGRREEEDEADLDERRGCGGRGGGGGGRRRRRSLCTVSAKQQQDALPGLAGAGSPWLRTRQMGRLVLLTRSTWAPLAGQGVTHGGRVLVVGGAVEPGGGGGRYCSVRGVGAA
jgi:hypothetical protein